MLRLGIIGDPLSHTLSPFLHRFLLEQSGIVGEYQAYETPADRLAERIAMFKDEGFRGFNITIPHKVKILEYLDSASSEATVIQAVNTVILSEGLLHGENTDITGFLKGLPDTVRESLPDRHGLILGGGGAARAVVAGLLRENIRTLTLRVRSMERAEGLAEILPSLREIYGSKTEVFLKVWEGLPDLHPFNLVVNTTPIGMRSPKNDPLEGGDSPLTESEIQLLPPDTLVYDLVYRPLQTPLLSAAQTRGLATEGGLKMLVYQGTEAFTHWTGHPVSPELAEAALKHILEAL